MMPHEPEPCGTCHGAADPEAWTYCATCCPAPKTGAQPASDYINQLEDALERAGKRAFDSRARDRRSRQQRDEALDAITHHRKGKLFGSDTSDEVDEALWAARDKILSAAHSKDLDGFGLIGNASEDTGSVVDQLPDDAMHLSIDRRMTESCPTCGTPVRVVSGDEGTSHYEPA